MRKKILIIGASFVALMLSVALFAISVIAAVGQEFGVNNKITFTGTAGYLAFELDAKITGVVNEENYKFEWDYDYSNPEKNEESKAWNIGALQFQEENVSEWVITYEFTIINKSDRRILIAYIEEPEIDENVLSCEIESNDENLQGIAKDGKLTLTLKLKAKSYFKEAKNCDFRVLIDALE